MLEDKKTQYKRILSDRVSSVMLKRWPYNGNCGRWEKHKPDEKGKDYSIYLNRTRGKRCGKITLIHELEHIIDDLTGVVREHGVIEGTAVEFCEKNWRFVGRLWERYVGSEHRGNYN